MPRSYAPIVERFDVIVVGAGPAGSLTAHLLAREGVRTLLVDRARFPRDKPCGGGVTMRGLRLLPFAIGPVVERQITTIAFRHPALGAFEHGGIAPVVLMTQRKRLDAFLAEQAALAGADFRDGVKLRAVELAEDGRPVVTFDDGSQAGAEILVAADGANGICGRSLDLGQDRIFAPALEANVAYDAVGAGVERHVALLEMGYVPGGYGWVFPKGDHANVGVGGWDSQGPLLRDHLRAVCERHGIAWESLTELRGHRLPMRGDGTQVAARSRAGHRRRRRPRRSALGRRHVRGVHERARGDGLHARRASTAGRATSRPIRRGSTTRSGGTPRWPGSPRPRSSARPAWPCAWLARAPIRRPFLLRTATSRDPLARTAPHPAWLRAERVARRLLGPEAGLLTRVLRPASARRSGVGVVPGAVRARTRRWPRARRRRRSGGR